MDIIRGGRRQGLEYRSTGRGSGPAHRTLCIRHEDADVPCGLSALKRSVTSWVQPAGLRAGTWVHPVNTP